MQTRNRIALDREPDHLGVLTLVLWLLGVSGAILGFCLPYARPAVKATPLPVVALEVQAELRPVEPSPRPQATQPRSAELPVPPPAEPFAPPPVLAPIAVARPDPARAFPIPVQAEPSVAEARLASATAQPVVPEVATAPPEDPRPVRLVPGEGEGRQAAPEYPRRALLQRQEGTVVVRIDVGIDGTVMAARLEIPSPWPLLNEAALTVVRERWRFRPGPRRLYDAPIRFEITR